MTTEISMSATVPNPLELSLYPNGSVPEADVLQPEQAVVQLITSSQESDAADATRTERLRQFKSKAAELGSLALQTVVVKPYSKTITKLYHWGEAREPRTTPGMILKGAALGIPETVADYGNTISQTYTDFRQISKLENAKFATDDSAEANRLVEFAKRKSQIAKLAVWYGGAIYYQVADDSLTYPLYLKLHQQLGTGEAYGIAAAAGFGLAASVGMGQRWIEGHKARLRGADTVEADVDDHGRRLLDASVNSAPWQVTVVANRARRNDETVPLLPTSKIAQYAGAYAVANTALYVAAESMPVGEWTGFGLSLAAVWTLGGVWTHTKERVLQRATSGRSNYSGRHRAAENVLITDAKHSVPDTRSREEKV